MFVSKYISQTHHNGTNSNVYWKQLSLIVKAYMYTSNIGSWPDNEFCNTSCNAAMKDLNRCVTKSSALVLLYFLSSSLLTRQFHRQSSNIGSWCWDVHNTISDYVKQNPYTVSLVVHDLFYYSPSSRTRKESPT